MSNFFKYLQDNPVFSASSSRVGCLLSNMIRCLEALATLAMSDVMCTGSLIEFAWFAIPRSIDCLIQYVA